MAFTLGTLSLRASITTQCRCSIRALSVAVANPRSDLFSSNVTIANLAEEGRLEEARSVFDRMPDRDKSSWNALITAYVKKGHLADARSAFDRMLVRDVVSWNIMITAYARGSRGEEALQLFCRMGRDGVKPNRITFVSALGACASLDDTKVVHESIARAGFSSELIVGTVLVQTYGKYGDVEHARKVFDGMAYRDVVCWTAMIAAYAQAGHGKQAVEIFEQMDREGVKLDWIALTSVLEASSSLEDIRDGKMIHAFIARLGFTSHIAIGTALILMYGRSKDVKGARRIYDKIPCLDAISCTSMIAVYVNNGQGKRVFELFHQMDSEGVKGDNITFASVLDACATLADPHRTKLIHATIVERGYEEYVNVANGLVTAYGKCGELENGRKLFDRIAERDLSSWNAMIAGYTHNGKGGDALQLFYKMVPNNTQPDKITFVSILDACAIMAALEQGKTVHAGVMRYGLDTDVVVATALVHMYGSCGCLEDAISMFERMHERNLFTWNAMITTLAHHGQGKSALELLRKMVCEGVKPNKVTFITILCACSRARLLDDGRSCFVSMFKDHAVTPEVGHYACLIDLLARAGELDEAFLLVAGHMPFEPPFQLHAVSWQCLLGACKVHGYVEGGAYAAEHLLELEESGTIKLDAVLSMVENLSEVDATMKGGQMLS